MGDVLNMVDLFFLCMFGDKKVEINLYDGMLLFMMGMGMFKFILGVFSNIAFIGSMMFFFGLDFFGGFIGSVFGKMFVEFKMNKIELKIFMWFVKKVVVIGELMLVM